MDPAEQYLADVFISAGGDHGAAISRTPRTAACLAMFMSPNTIWLFDPCAHLKGTLLATQPQSASSLSPIGRILSIDNPNPVSALQNCSANAPENASM